jgi:hypothetical protein
MGCSIFEPTVGRCKRPCGTAGPPEFFFCDGKAEEGQVYCDCHKRRARGWWIGVLWIARSGYPAVVRFLRAPFARLMVHE